MKRRTITIISVAVVFLVLASVYFFTDPAETVWMPKCAFFMLTGLKCPGCGSQRAFHALLRGEFGEAWSQNAFMVIMIPVILFLLWLEIRRDTRPELYRKVHTPLNIILFGVITVIWTLGRNIF